MAMLMEKSKAGASLCRSCRYAHVLGGYGEGEELIFCTFATTVSHLIPFAVRSCTEYHDRDIPVAEELEKAYHC